jgi:hypothetical protein
MKQTKAYACAKTIRQHGRMLHCSPSYCCVMCPALFGPRAAPAVGSVKKKQDFVRLFKYVHIHTILHPDSTAGDRNQHVLDCMRTSRAPLCP